MAKKCRSVDACCHGDLGLRADVVEVLGYIGGLGCARVLSSPFLRRLGVGDLHARQEEIEGPSQGHLKAICPRARVGVRESAALTKEVCVWA